MIEWIEKNGSSNVVKPFHASIDSYLKPRKPKPSSIAPIATTYISNALRRVSITKHITITITI
jgi:hypothetical protein